MATVSFGGLGNGLDFGQVVSELVKVQRLPIDKLSQTQKTIQTKLTDYGALGTKLLTMQNAANTLRTSTGFGQVAVKVSDETVLSATASSSATPGSYTLKATQLAAAHQITHKAANAVPSLTTDIVTGALAAFTFKVGSGTDQTVTLSATATIEDLKNAINDLGVGVGATILNAGTSSAPAYRLVLTSISEGAANNITIVTDTTDLDFKNTNILHNPGLGGTDTLQAGQDAVLVVGDPAQNPVTLQRSSNTISDAISGVTLNLKKITTAGAAVTVTLSRDTGAIATNIKAMVTAYNDVIKFINERNAYDAEAKKGGVFFAEGGAKTVVSRLRQALSNDVSGLSTYTSVGQVGFKTERDGTIVLDEAALNTAIGNNYNFVNSLFTNQTGSTGVARRLYETVDALDDIESGVVTLRKDSLTKESKNLTEQIRRKEDNLDAYEARLREQYAALDGLLRQLQGQIDFLRSRL